MLKNAVIAIEDVRFYKHNGVDIKRLVSAIINTFLNQNTHGGSTITQQLIKIRFYQTSSPTSARSRRPIWRWSLRIPLIRTIF